MDTADHKTVINVNTFLINITSHINESFELHFIARNFCVHLSNARHFCVFPFLTETLLALFIVIFVEHQAMESFLFLANIFNDFGSAAPAVQ
jgi:hypothetical protein